MCAANVQPRSSKYDSDIDDIDNVEDGLERTSIVRSLANEIRSPASPRPKVIGVYGWWGAGKSHLLRLVIKQLWEENPRDQLQVIVVTYQTWRYEFEGDLALGLIKSLHGIQKKFKGKNPELPDEGQIKKAAFSVLAYIAEITKFIPLYGEVISEVAKPTAKLLTDLYNPKPIENPTVDALREKMQKLVNEILAAAKRADNTKEYRLVVFLDDLDRCSPENLVKLLEWLKVHLTVEGCTYVLALDHNAAARAIVGQYKKYLGDETDLAYGFRYLEKLVDYEYELGIAGSAEKMAVKRINPKSESIKISQIATELSGGDFPGVGNIDSLLKLRALLNPRTMLKITDKFTRAMKVLLSPETSELRNQLPASYPFWVIFLVSMYYSLDPSILDEFIKGRGKIYQLVKKPGSVPVENYGKEPLREFCEFANHLGKSSSSSFQVPPEDILLKLMAVVRENCYTQ